MCFCDVCFIINDQIPLIAFATAINVCLTGAIVLTAHRLEVVAGACAGIAMIIVYNASWFAEVAGACAGVAMVIVWNLYPITRNGERSLASVIF